MTIGFASPHVSADPDPWFGADKWKHFGVSSVVAGASYGVAATQVQDRWAALAIGGGVALAAGAAKEGVDALGYGDPSWKDLAWDGIGAVAGLLVALAIDVAVRGVGDPAFVGRP
jgi:putative lipoprotein